VKRHAPATARNAEPLANVLASELPEKGLVLEIASGTGEHAVFLARRFPQLRWQPSDRDEGALDSIRAWASEAALENIADPILLDTASIEWPIEHADALLCVNMVHISPWEATEGLFAGAAEVLGRGAPLILYGPFIEDGVETAASNLAFDRSLKDRDSRWGLRRLDDLDRLAAKHRFVRTERHAMPANNLVLVYRQTEG
jgi:cyclopropane fatty-acyl-phospholipid synthase-like methyltransferase|tara:strand:+ start:558 stop:1157 length:600 start_codon:yes stop_codon:yes gene_type:complete